MHARRLTLQTSEDEIIRQQVEDAIAATQPERIEAMVVLLDSAYALWARKSREPLCRPPLIQERRRGLLSERRRPGG